MTRPKLVLVTGASGFVGSALARKLVDNEYCNPRAAIRRGTESGAIRSANCPVVTVDDLRAECDWQNAIQDVDVVVHLAALAHRTGVADLPSLAEYRAVNTAGSVALARQAAAAGVRRFVFLSSIGVVGNRSTEAFTESSDCRPHSAYAQSKYEAELELADISRKSGMELVVIRPPLVYGAQAPANFRRLVKLVHRLPLLPFGLVNNSRSFIFIENLVDFIELCCVEARAAGEVFLIADGENLSTRALTNLIARNLGKRIIQLPVPPVLMRLGARVIGKSQLASQLLYDLEIDCSKAKRLLNWSARFSPGDAIAACDFSRMLE